MLAVGSRPIFAQKLKSLVIAEPVHNLGYAPVYIAMDQGYFKKRGLDVSLLQATNGSHVTALVSGQVWGNIGGPESDAMANVGKADPLRAICNLVNRANLYLVARKGLAPKSASKADLAAFLKGKKFALARHGRTPDLLGRWLVHDVGLNPETDIEPVNQADMAAVLALMKNGVVDVAITQEPFIRAGIEQGLWDQPSIPIRRWAIFPIPWSASPIHDHQRTSGRTGLRRCRYGSTSLAAKDRTRSRP